MSRSQLKRLLSMLTPPSGPSVLIHSPGTIRQLMADYKEGKVLYLGSGRRVLSSEIIRLDIEHHPNVTVQGDACLLPFERSVFAPVICSFVLEYVKTFWLAFNELHRVVKPGGIILIEMPFIFPFHSATPHDRHDYIRLTLEGLRSLVAKDEIIPCGLAVSYVSMLMLILVEWVSRLFYIKEHTGMYYFVRNSLSWIFYPLCWLDKWIDKIGTNDVIGGAYYLVAKRSQV